MQALEIEPPRLPMLISICGVVVDVSPSENFVPNFGYGKREVIRKVDLGPI